jgi:hypothetical protein
VDNVRKEPINIVFESGRKRDIDVKVKKKVDDYEEILEPKIIKESREYKIVREIPLTEIQLEL